jgi:hypothetical protein
MATLTKIAPPPPPLLAADPGLIPVHEDSRVVEVRRRQAHAADLRDRAVARRKQLQATLDDTATAGLARLEAQRDLPDARIAERDAEIGYLLVEAEEQATRAAHDGLVAAIAELNGALGAHWDGTGTDTIVPFFTRPHGASESTHETWRRWLRSNGWLDD